MPTGIVRRTRLYGYPNPQTGLQQEPIVMQTAPTTSDAAELGTVWVNELAGTAYILAQITTALGSVSYVWVSVSGGAGVFSSLTVNPGPTNLSTVGNGAVSIGNATNTGAITITAGTGNISLVGAGHSINVGTDNAANTVVVGSINAGGATTIQGGGAILVSNGTVAGTITIGSLISTGLLTLGESTAGQNIVIGTTAATFGNSTTINGGDGGISLNAPEPTAGFSGYVSVPSTKPTAASPTATVTRNSRVMVAIFTGFTTAAAGTQVFTIVSSRILANSAILVSVSNLNASGNGATMQIQGVTQAVGSIAVSTVNSSLAALGAGDNVLVSVWILD